ncbi:hypothetical protein Pla123a_22050 [Posidoniimonas polymericola]|uniref:Immunoglobulin G-binding protein A n=1 Tax=Posidoniimonas polymericola TaxID=2528002 RepID=A0A5C5YRG0_9BACT|nr:hypothetical protein [Posidoniimonas polymericola]TWT77544.1 hypothetical protein Pla123a_22050 [Posidoniimonas polymericola]
MPKLPAAFERSSVLKAIRSADAGPEVIEYDRYVDQHIRRTGRAVQATEIAYAVMALAVGWLAFILIAALAEHWLTERGFSDGLRYVLFALAVGATAWGVKKWLWPLLTSRINPLYTAKSIEQSAPSLKNSLINLLTLRGDRPLPPAVLATLEQQAAEGISRAPDEAVVDRSRVVRMAAVMVGLLTVVSLYALLSAKDPFTTAARIVAPWAKIAAPSRVKISDVTPGDATLVEGQMLDIEARIEGLADGEEVEVVLTSDDGQRVDDRQRLAFDQQLNRYTLALPTLAEPGKRPGLTGKVRYRVEAGDGRSPTFVATVLPAPAIVVTGVDYRFPEYTGLLDYTQENSGDLRAIERTRVTLHARANTPLASAYVDFDADGSRDVTMTIDGDTATASFELALRPDRQTPKHTGYVLRLKTPADLTNAKPARHAIEVYPDYPPEAEITAPAEPDVTVRLNETLRIRGTARDPDFGLSDVRIVAERDGRRVLQERLLVRPIRTKFDVDYAFTPTSHGLQAGDVVEYWLEASDIRRPDPQTVTTRRQTLRIASPEGSGGRQGNEMADAGDPGKDDAQGDDPQQGEQGQAGDQGQEGDQGQQGESGEEGTDGQPDQNQQGQEGQREQDGGQQGEGGAEQDSEDQQGEGDANQQQGESNQASEMGSQQQPEGEEGQQEEQQGQEGEGGAGSQTDERGAAPNSEDPQQGQQSQDEGGEGESGGQSSGGQNDSRRNSDQNNRQRGAGGNQSGKQTGSHEKPQEDASGGGTPTEREQAVDDSGADDGEAFERMLEHMQENQGDQNNGQGKPREAAAQDHPADNGESGDKSQGAGADTLGGDLDNEPEEDQQDASESGESKGGLQQSPRGDPSTPGAKGEPKGSPTVENDRRPTQKSRTRPDPSEKTEEAQSAASKKEKSEAESQNESGGEQSGGGAEGGGQRADQQGSGSAGQHQAADEGAGRASEQGQGEAGEKGGTDQRSDSQTGERGRDSGEGSTEQQGQGDKAGGEQGGDQSGDQNPSEGRQADPNQSPENQPSDQSDPTNQGESAQAGQGAEGQSQQESESGDRADSRGQGGRASGPTDGGDVGGDDANLRYAREKTDLVLEKLSDQLKEEEVDPELLDRLGWNEDQLRRFVERWNQRKEAARRAPSSKATADLDAALRGLGRLPGSPATDTQRTIDELRNNAGARNAPAPMKWRERLQRYNQGVSGGSN